MAEAGALSLVARLASMLNSEFTKIFIDNQSLVTNLNGESQTTLPDLGMKPLTHDFFNSNRGKQYKVFKISRTQNITARSLARQAYSFVAGLGQSLLHTKLSQPPPTIITAYFYITGGEIISLTVRRTVGRGNQ